MKNNPFNARFDLLQGHLDRLSPQNRVSFALNCARQVLHKYEQWAITEPWAKPEVMRDALQLVEQSINNDLTPIEPLKQIAEQVYESVPDSEEFLSSSDALDAGLAVYFAVKCALDPTTENAFGAGEHAITAYDISSTTPQVPIPQDGIYTAKDYAKLDLTPEGLAEWRRQLALIDTFENRKPAPSPDLTALKALFEFGDDDLRANREGRMSERQRESIQRERNRVRVDYLAQWATYPVIAALFVLYFVTVPPLGDSLGPGICLVIAAMFAILAVTTYGWWQMMRWVLHRVIPPLSIDDRDLVAQAGRIHFEDDGEHRYLFLGEDELQTSVTVGQDKRLWQLTPDRDYILYIHEPTGQVLSVESLS